MLWLSACASIPPGNELDFPSGDYVFLDAALNGAAGKPRTVHGRLMLPQRDAEPVPAVIVTHSSWGRSRQEWEYAQLLLAEGIAVFAIDSFRPRGVFRTSEDQSLVSEQEFQNAELDLRQLQLAYDEAKRELGYTIIR